jgi:DNA-binding transcriptional ArsR family regulator
MMTDALGQTLAAIADPTRRAIIDQLARGPARVTDLAAPFSMSLNGISKHLKVLEKAGVVRRARRGREHVLALEAAPLRDVAQWAHRYERYWNDRFDRLEKFFADRNKESKR